MSYEGPGIASSDHDHDHRPAASQPRAISHNSDIFSSTSTNERSSDKRARNQMVTSNDLQSPAPHDFASTSTPTSVAVLLLQ
jgi:hypothetical protein